MKTYKKGDYFFLEFPEDILAEYDEELDQILKTTIDLKKFHIVLDLKNTKFLSSLTLRIIIKYQKAVQAAEKSLFIINPDSEIISLLETTNIDKILKIFDSEEEMFKAISEQRQGDAQTPEEDEAGPGEFTYELKEHDQVVVVRMAGFIRKLSDMLQFEEEVISYIKQNKLNFLFNLEMITFMDSSSMGRFVKLNHFLKSKGGKVAFCSPSEIVQDFFKILGLEKMFQVFQTEEEALTLFQ